MYILYINVICVHMYYICIYIIYAYILYAYLYVYIYISICIYTCAYMCICTYMYMYMYTYMTDDNLGFVMECVSEMWWGSTCRVSLLCRWSSDNITGGPAAHTNQSLWFKWVRVITLAHWCTGTKAVRVFPNKHYM